jgi:hypothetical protein
MLVTAQYKKDFKMIGERPETNGWPEHNRFLEVRWDDHNISDTRQTLAPASSDRPCTVQDFRTGEALNIMFQQ